MATKRSQLWNYFDEIPENHTKARCKVPGCRDPIVSRGKDGASKSSLGTTALRKHLEKNHKLEFKQFTALQSSDEESKKRKASEEEEENEMESAGPSKLKTSAEKNKFMKTQLDLGSSL